jgi:hypothetical protein
VSRSGHHHEPDTEDRAVTCQTRYRLSHPFQGTSRSDLPGFEKLNVSLAKGVHGLTVEVTTTASEAA